MRRQSNPLSLLASVTLLLTLVSRACADEPTKAAIPTAAQQNETAADLEEVYELSAANTKAKKQELIPKLMKLADDAVKAKDFGQLYGILQAIFPLVRDTGDVTTFLTAMQMLTENFALDAAEGGQRLDEFLNGCDSSAAFEEITGKLLPTIEQVARLNRLDQADDMLKVIEIHAKRIPNTTPVTKQKLADIKNVVRERRRAFNRYQSAVSKLDANPGDPEANFIAGAWLAVFEDDWAGALPKLAKGSDSKWKSAAEAELQVSRLPDEQAEMAGLWWDIANGISGESSTKRALQKHVYYWYTRVVKNISKPLLKTVVERHIAELNPVLETIAANPQLTSNNPSPKAAVQNKNGADGKLPIGEAINLLNLITLPENAIEGDWRTIDGALNCSPSPDARVMAPVVVSGNYEVGLEFERNAGTNMVALICPVGGTTCEITLSGWRGALAGLHTIDGKYGPDIKDKQAVVRPGKLDNGQRYLLQVKIQENRGAVNVIAQLNRKTFVDWRGDAHRLAAPTNSNLPSIRSVGIRVYDSNVTVHSFQLVVSKGGEGYRLQNDWKNPLDIVAAAPHRDIAKECAPWDGKNYFIAPKPMAYSDAQRLATRLQGRMLTISSQAENEFIYQLAKGRRIWTAGWRSGSSNVWRDERNRPLRLFEWDSGQPDNRFGRQLRLITRGVNSRWDDDTAYAEGYACIEWGEEYPVEQVQVKPSANTSSSVPKNVGENIRALRAHRPRGTTGELGTLLDEIVVAAMNKDGEGFKAAVVRAISVVESQKPTLLGAICTNADILTVLRALQSGMSDLRDLPFHRPDPREEGGRGPELTGLPGLKYDDTAK